MRGMPVYLVIEIEVHDPALYAEYVARVPATVKEFGGRYLARGGKVKTLAGDWHPERLVVVEFPSEAAVREWFASPEYAAVRPLRERSTKGRVVLIEGCPPEPA
jgi:uncharacterized protein (DUF1330 family)